MNKNQNFSPTFLSISLTNVNPLIRKVLESILDNKEINPALFDNTVHYKIFKKVSKKEIDRLYVSTSYLVVKLRDISGYYVVGINSETGKVFVRGIDGIIVLEESKPLMINDIIIEICNDSDIRRFLGYDKEFEEVDIEKIETPIRVRVQGDIILEILDVNCERMYWKRVKESLEHHIKLMYTDLLLEKLRDLLTHIGLHTIIVEREIRVELPKCTKTLLTKFSKLVERLIKTSSLLSELENEFKTKLISINISEKIDDNPRISIVSEKGDIYIDFSFGTTWIRGIIIEVQLDKKLIENKVNEILKELDINYRERTVRIGRHIARFQSLPTDILLKLKIFDRERLLTINNLPLIIKGKLEILHQEHKPFRISFPLPTQINLLTIPVSESFIIYYNYFKLRELLKNL